MSYEDIVRNIRSQAAEINATRYPDASTPKEVTAPSFEDYSNNLGYVNADYEAKKQIQQSWLGQHGDAWRQAGRDPAADLAQYAPLSAPQKGSIFDTDWIDSAAQSANRAVSGMSNTIASYLNDGKIKQNLQDMGKYYAQEANIAESNFNPITRDEIARNARLDAELSKKYNGDVPLLQQAGRAIGEIATAPVRTLASVAGSSAVQLPALAATAAGTALGGAPGALLAAAGTVGGLALNTGTVAGEVGQGAYDAVMAVPVAKLENTEPFKKAFADAKALNLSNIEAERAAQRAVAEDAQRFGGKIGGGIGFISGLVSAGFGAGAAAKKAAGKAAGQHFLKSLGVETASEATEEVVTQGAQNYTQQQAGMDTKISEGLVKAGILGAYGGGAQAGAAHGIGKAAKATVSTIKGKQQDTQQDAPTLDQAKSNISFDERLNGMPDYVKTMAEDLVQTVIDNPNPTPDVQESIDSAKSSLKSYGFTDQDLANVYGATVEADPAAEKQPITGTKASEIQVGTYKPAETGGEPGTQAPVRLATELAKAGPITLESVNEVAVKHEQGYSQWVQGTRSEVSRIPKQDFIAGTADNILATAALMGLPMDERTTAVATEALANAQASEGDINNLGSRLTADGNSLMSESEYQATQNGTANDVVGKYVLYGNAEGYVIKRDNGLYVVDNRPGNTHDIFIEGGESQSTPAQLGIKIMNPPMVNLPAQRVGSGAAPATQVAQAQLTYEQALFEDALNLLVMEVGPQQAETFLAALEMRINEGATPAQIAKEIENEINAQSRNAGAQTSNDANDAATNIVSPAKDSQSSTNNDAATNGIIDTADSAEAQAEQLRADKEQRAADYTKRIEGFLYGLDTSLRGKPLSEMLPDVRVVAEMPQRFANEVAKYLNDNNLPWLDRFGEPTTDHQELAVNGVREGASLRRLGDGLTYIFAGNSVSNPVSTLLHETWHKYQNREGDKNKAASLWNQVQDWSKAKPDTLQRRAYEYGKQVMDSGDRMNGPLEMVPVILNYLWAEGVRPQTKGELGSWVNKVLATIDRFVSSMLGLPALSEQHLMDVAAQMVLGDATGKPSTEFLGEKEKTRKNTEPSFSVADIAKLTDNGRSLKEFSQQFAGSIKQADRKVEDADKIALDYIYDVLGSPSSVLPQVSGASLSYKQYLRMPDGTDYDPNKLEHITATDLTKSIYAAVKSGRIEQALEQEAKATNDSRAKDLSGLARYLKNNLEYRPTEAAVILKAASKWGMRMTTNNDKAVVQLVEITNKNATAIAVLTGLDASALAEEMRKGLPLKAAFQAALQGQVDLREKKALESGKEGWVVYKKSDKHEDHVALRDGCVGREWCTAGAVSTAASQLRRGDFHVFYKKGEPIVALRTEDGRLGEAPRGSLPGQALTEEERGIAERRLRGQQEPSKPANAVPVTGGEDFLEDQAFMAAVKENNFDNYSDMQLWMMQGYKLKAGDFSKSKLPSSATSVIKRAILKRKSKEQWSIEGYATGTATTDWEKAKYVSGDMVLNKDKIAKNVLVVKGYVELSGNAAAPNLTTVGGDIRLLDNASAPLVTTVGGDIELGIHTAAPPVTRKNIGKAEALKGTPLDTNYKAPTLEPTQPTITGGEDFLDDQKVLNDIKSGAVKDYPDFSLFQPHQAPRTLKDTQDALVTGRVKSDPWYLGAKDWAVKVFADATRPFDAWAKGFGTPQEQERLIQTKDLAKTRASSLTTAYDQKYAVPLSQALNKVLKDTDIKDMETAKHLVGTWMSAIYAPLKNADFIAQDAKAVAEAEQAFIEAGGDMVGLRAELSASSTTKPSQARLTARTEAASKRFSKASDKVKETSRAYVRALEHQEIRIQAINDPDSNMDPTETRALAGLAGGYNNATAAKVAQDIEAKIPKALLEEAAKPVYGMLKAKSQLDIQTGKVALSVSSKWFNHPRYVPLTGDPRTDDSTSDIFGTGSMNQSKDKAAEGRRSSLAQNAIDAAFEQLGKSVNYYGWLPFKQELTATYERLLKQYGTDQAVFENSGIKRSRETPQTNITGSIVFRNGADVTKNGGGWVYTLDSEAAIQGLQEANIEPSPGMFKYAALATRLVSRSIVLMPGFAAVNVWRDGPERFINIATRELKNYPGVKMGEIGRQAALHWANPSTFITIKNVLADRMSLPSLTKGLAKIGGNDADADLLREMLEQGASSTTGSYTSRDTQDLAKKLSSIDSTLTKQINNLVWWSDSFELKAPFSIYKALRAQNVDARTASAMVLSTMNFTKHGAAMSPLKSLYMFAQPAVTGAHQTAKTLATTKGKIIGAGLFFTSMAVYALLSEMGGEDPVSKRRRIDMLNAGTVEKSLPIYMPDGSVVKVPVPFGLYQLAWSAAANTMRAANGTTNMADAGLNIFKSGLKSISPIGVAETEFTKDPFVFLAQMFTPTIAKPVTNVATNTNTFGSSISNDVKPGQPAWRQARKDTPDIYVDTSKWMLDNANINTSPETLQELTGLIAYGPLGEARKGLIDNPAKDERGIKRPSQMIDRFVMEQADSKTASAYYYEVRSELAKIHLRKLSAKPGESDLTEKERQLNAILEADDRVHSTTSSQWAQLRKMKNDGRVSDDEYRQRYQQLTQRDNESRARFITRYNEVK